MTDPITDRIAEMQAEEALRQLAALSDAEAENIEQMEAELAGLDGDLGNIKRMLQVAKAAPGGTAVVNRAGPIAQSLFGRRAVLSKRIAMARKALGRRRRLCSISPITRKGKGPISAKDRQGTLPLPVKPYAIINIKAGELGANFPRQSHNGFELFNVGQRDQGGAYQVAGVLDESHTSFEKDGQLPDGHWLETLGVDVTIISTGEGPMSDADLDVLGRGRCAWHEPGDKAVIPLPFLGQMPSPEMVGASRQRRASFFGGKVWRSPRPLFHLRSGDRGHKLSVTFPDPDAELSQPCLLLVELAGVQGVVPSASR